MGVPFDCITCFWCLWIGSSLHLIYRRVSSRGQTWSFCPRSHSPGAYTMLTPLIPPSLWMRVLPALPSCLRTSPPRAHRSTSNQPIIPCAAVELAFHACFKRSDDLHALPRAAPHAGEPPHGVTGRPSLLSSLKGFTNHSAGFPHCSSSELFLQLFVEMSIKWKTLLRGELPMYRGCGRLYWRMFSGRTWNLRICSLFLWGSMIF